MRVFGKGRVWIATNSDDFYLKTRDRRQDTQKFLGFAAGTQGEDDIAVGHHPEIAVQRVQRIEDNGGRTGAGEGGRDLAADVSRFSHPYDHNFTSGLACLLLFILVGVGSGDYLLSSAT